MLTNKQMEFCKEYLRNGGNATQAYLTAYDSESPKSAVVDASRLMRRDDIKEQIERLSKPMEKAIVRKIVNEREYKKKLIQERIDECVAKGDDAAIARYIEIWNKMDGEYVNINKDITDHNAMVKDLDTATLLQLVQSEQVN